MVRRRKKKEIKVQSMEDFWPPKWFFSYSDLSTLMMTFFMVLATMVALKVPLHLVSKPGKGKDIIPLSAAEMKKVGKLFGLDEKTLGNIKKLKELEKEREQQKLKSLPAAKTDEVEALYRALKDFTASNSLDDKVRVEKLGAGLNLNISSAVLFKPGSYRLSDDARLIADALSEFIKAHPSRVIIEGHTDNQPIHTPEIPSNWELSIARANSFMRYLIDKRAMPVEFVEAVGFGEFRPLASNDTEGNRRLNRRLVVKLSPL